MESFPSWTVDALYVTAKERVPDFGMSLASVTSVLIHFSLLRFCLEPTQAPLAPFKVENGSMNAMEEMPVNLQQELLFTAIQGMI